MGIRMQRGDRMSKAKKIALSGMMAALAAAIMMLGGLIPIATFCCPAIAGLCLIPIFVECGERMAWAGYVAVALLSIFLSPDKESALLFIFLGYYPVLKWRIDMLRPLALRIGTKFALFNVAVLIMYALCLFVFKLDQVLRDYQDLSTIMLTACIALGNICLFLYDRLIPRFTSFYVHRAGSARRH